MKIASPKLELFYKKGRLKFARGGRGSVKSWGWAQAIVIFMTNYNMRVLCCREIQQSIKSSSYQLLVDTIERYGLTNDFEILKTEIRHKTTGALVVFVGLKSNPEAIKSYEAFDIAVVEEAENVTDLSIKILHATIFRNKGSQVWYIWNPRYATDPVEKLAHERSDKEGVFVEHFTWEDNPYWTEEMELERIEMLEISQEQHDWVFGGDYLSEGSMRLFSFNLIKASQALQTIDHRDCKRILGVDVARMGADSTALCLRNGNRLEPFKMLKGFDTNQLERAIDDYIVEHKVEVIVIDCTGGHGTGLLDILKKKYAPIGVEVIEYNSSYGANSSEYYNARAEVYDSAKKWVENGGKVINDDLFVEELQNIEYFYNKTNNKFQMEPKEVLKSRIGRSPDKMDAFTMTFFVTDERPNVATKISRRGKKKTWRF
jgi:PBSX family phage terminase large subunit